MFRLSILGGICVPGGYLPKLEGKVMTIEYRVSIPQGLEPFPLLCWSLCHPRSGVDPEFFHGKKSLKSRWCSSIFWVRYLCQLKRIFFLNWGGSARNLTVVGTFWSCWSCFMLYQVIAALRICCRVSGTSCRGNDLITSVSILEMHVSRNLVNPQIPQLVNFFESRKNI